MITCIGMATIDYLRVITSYPKEDSENPVIESCDAVGGLAGRGAITIARLGADCKLIYTSGDDNISHDLESSLVSEGVVSCCYRQDNTLSQNSFVLISGDNGKRTTIWLPQPQASDRLIKNLGESINGSECILLDCTDELLTRAAISEANNQEIPIVLDTGSYKPWSDSILSNVQHIISPKKYFSKKYAEPEVERALLTAFKEASCDSFCLTDGELGGLFVSKNKPDEVFNYHPFEIKAIDTCGAGDTFHGAFTFALARKWEIKVCYEFSSWVAAQKCKALGNHSIPRGTSGYP